MLVTSVKYCGSVHLIFTYDPKTVDLYGYTFDPKTVDLHGYVPLILRLWKCLLLLSLVACLFAVLCCVSVAGGVAAGGVVGIGVAICVMCIPCVRLHPAC